MRKKLLRFAEVKTFSNVFESPETFKKADPKKPYTLELACGKGYYTVALAEQNPNQTVIGVDLKADRIWMGAKKALEQGISNALFIRTDIRKITDFLPKDSVNEIWITFPDPHPKKKKAKHRLTHPDFLKIYQQILMPSGLIHLKTDDPGLFNYTKEILPEAKATLIDFEPDIYNQGYKDPRLEIKTLYETKFLKKGKSINHLSFQFEL